MAQLKCVLILQEEYDKFYKYESQEEEEPGKPIIGGLYILRKTIGKNRPEEMKLSLEWT